MPKFLSMNNMNDNTATSGKTEEKPKRWLGRQFAKLGDWYHRDDNILRRVRFPGTQLPLLDVIINFFNLIFKGRVFDRAAGVAFNFILAVFPLILFFFTLIPHIPIRNLNDRVMLLLNDLLPAGTLDYVKGTIDSIVNQNHGGWLSLSIVLCLIFGSSGMVAIFNGFRNMYANYANAKGLPLNKWLIQRCNAILMLLVFGALIIVSILLISLGGIVRDKLVEYEILADVGAVFFLFDLLRWTIVIFGLGFGISLLYFFGNKDINDRYRKEYRHPRPDGKKYREFVIFSPGSILAIALFVLATFGFNLYISNFSRYNVLYGSIGTLIIIMLWIWIVATLILAGNDLNLSILRTSKKKNSLEEANTRHQVVIDELSTNIQRCQKENEELKKKIETLKKTIDEESVVLDTLMNDVKSKEIVIRAYQRFVDEESTKADEEKK